MDQDTRFLLRRMDEMEGRLLEKIDSLQAFKNRLVGMALVCGSIGALLVEMVLKHI